MSAPRPERSILVAGGGIGGFAAALALARKGIRVTILEQSDAFREVGAGIQLGPNGFRMFEALGITEAIDQTVVYPDALVMRDALSAEEVTRIPVNTPEFRERFRYPYGVIYRPDLHRALIDAATALPDVEALTGRKIVHIEETEEGVAVETANGERFEGAALIGADGLWSSVRTHILGDGRPRVSGHIAYRAVLEAAEVPETSRNNEVVLWAGPKTHLVHYPLHRSEIWNLVAVFHSDRYEEGWDEFGDPQELERRFAGQHPHVRAMLERIESWRMWVLCDREPVKDWARGRMTLLGDAAHPMLQYLAQGACMACEDAVCLAHHVAARPDDLPGAFEAYQADRYLRTARVQVTARFYGDVYHAAGPVAELRRMTLAGRSPQQSYDGVAWLYAGLDDCGRQVL